MSGPTGLFIASRDLIVYKKAWFKNSMPCLVTMMIPKGTYVFCKDSNGKHRAALAKVLKIEELRNPKPFRGYLVRNGKTHKTANSGWNCAFKYYVGKVARPIYNFGAAYEGECGSGIHFFRKESKARGY